MTVYCVYLTSKTVTYLWSSELESLDVEELEKEMEGEVLPEGADKEGVGEEGKGEEEVPPSDVEPPVADIEGECGGDTLYFIYFSQILLWYL